MWQRGVSAREGGRREEGEESETRQTDGRTDKDTDGGETERADGTSVRARRP